MSAVQTYSHLSQPTHAWKVASKIAKVSPSRDSSHNFITILSDSAPFGNTAIIWVHAVPRRWDKCWCVCICWTGKTETILLLPGPGVEPWPLNLQYNKLANWPWTPAWLFDITESLTPTAFTYWVLQWKKRKENNYKKKKKETCKTLPHYLFYKKIFKKQTVNFINVRNESEIIGLKETQWTMASWNWAAVAGQGYIWFSCLWTMSYRFSMWLWLGLMQYMVKMWMLNMLAKCLDAWAGFIQIWPLNITNPFGFICCFAHASYETAHILLLAVSHWWSVSTLLEFFQFNKSSDSGWACRVNKNCEVRSLIFENRFWNFHFFNIFLWNSIKYHEKS